MSDELFPASEVAMDSPRLVWLHKNNCITFHSLIEPPCWYAAFAEEPVAGGDDIAQWFFEEMGANGSSRCGEGETEDEAIADLARHTCTRLWNEEPEPPVSRA